MTTNNNAAPSVLTDEQVDVIADRHYAAHTGRIYGKEWSRSFARALLATAPRAAEQAPVDAATQAGTAPPGWKLVPVEPTQAMLDRGYWPCTQGRGAKSVWAEMLRAVSAPQAPVADAARDEPLGWVTDGKATYTLEAAAARGKTYQARAYAAASKALARIHEICLRYGCGNEVMHDWLERTLAAVTQQPARASEAGETHPDDAMRGDAIARSKRILALVDDYHERPTADNRTALRHALHDAFTAALAQQAVTLTDAARDLPGLPPLLTPFGMLVRALRIVANTTLYDMAKALLTTPAKLSAMEFGRAPVTSEFAFDVSAYFDALGIANTKAALDAALQSHSEGEAR